MRYVLQKSHFTDKEVKAEKCLPGNKWQSRGLNPGNLVPGPTLYPLHATALGAPHLTGPVSLRSPTPNSVHPQQGNKGEEMEGPWGLGWGEASRVGAKGEKHASHTGSALLSPPHHLCGFTKMVQGPLPILQLRKLKP